MKGEKTQTGREAWLFICAHVEACLPRVATKGQIKQAAAIIFRCNPTDFPESRLDEAQRERCGAKTLRAFQDRARELGLPEPDGLKEAHPHNDQGDIIGRLETEAHRRAERFGDPGHPQVEVLRDAIAALRAGH